MIQSKPILIGKAQAVRSFAATALGITVMMLAPACGRFQFIVQIAALAICAYGLNILIRYILTDYLYTVKDEHLTIHRINRKRSLCVADVSIVDILHEPMTKEEFEKYQKEHDVGKQYVFCKNPGCDKIRYLVCSLDTAYTVVFEPDEPMIEELNSVWKTVMERKEEESDDDDI